MTEQHGWRLQLTLAHALCCECCGAMHRCAVCIIMLSEHHYAVRGYTYELWMGFKTNVCGCFAFAEGIEQVELQCTTHQQDVCGSPIPPSYAPKMSN